MGFPKKYLSILNKTKKNCFNVSEIYDYWYGKGGMTPKVNKTKNGIKVLTGKEINRYFFNDIDDKWYLNNEFLSEFEINRCNQEKVVVQDIVAHINKPRPHIKLTSTIDSHKQFCLNTVMCFTSKSKDLTNIFLVCLINSKFMSFYFYFFIFNQAIRTMHFMPGYADKIPIPKNYKEFHEEISSLGSNLLKSYEDLNNQINSFSKFIYGKFAISKLSNKINKWHKINFKVLLKEIQKESNNINLHEQVELMQYFEEQKERIKVVQSEIDTTDKEIDQMIYKLYGLTDEEIKIVEGSI